jgi:transposase
MEWHHLHSPSKKKAKTVPSAAKVMGRNIILHDNAHPHAARLTLEAIAKMGWEVLPHPSYIPDLAPSDYLIQQQINNKLHGFSPLVNYTNGLTTACWLS